MSTLKTSLTYCRYELKYHIPLSMVPMITEFIAPFCNLDHFSSIEEDNYYTINSLYFDSPNFLFLDRKRNKVAKRFNMRARSYGQQPKPPFFLEVKEKQTDIVNKKRVKIDFENWQDVLFDPEVRNSICGESSKYLQDFLRYFIQHNAEPKILTRYRRMAYFSTIDEYVRITFDRDMQFQYENGYNLCPDSKLTHHYDNSDAFKGSGGNIVLEIKSLTRVPYWVLDLIARFELKQNSFSKYESSVVNSTTSDQYDDSFFDLVPSSIGHL